MVKYKSETDNFPKMHKQNYCHGQGKAQLVLARKWGLYKVCLSA